MDIFSWLLGPSQPQGSIDGPGLFDVEVVGESNYHRAIKRLRGASVRTQATLVLEDSNPYDDHAVRVDIEGETVGYLDRENARAYRRELERVGHPRLVGTCAAKIVGGRKPTDGSKDMFGVLLDLPTVD
jgi:hypothetical protein